MIQVSRNDTDADKWAKALAPLREKPGEWDEMPAWVPPSVATIIEAGDYRGVPAGVFEARVVEFRVQVRARGA